VYRGRIPEAAHHSSWCADRAIDFLRRHDTSQPFFLWVGFPDPHHPWAPPETLCRQFEGRGAHGPVAFQDRPATPTIRGFEGLRNTDLRVSGANEETVAFIREYTNAQIHLVDRAVGRVLDQLEQQGLDEETVIVFTSDHGDFLGDYGLIRKGGCASRVLCHVPLIIRVPGGPRGEVVSEPVSNVNVTPTLLGVLGLERENSARPGRMDGVDVLASRPADHTAMVQTFGTGSDCSFSVLDDRYRYTYYPQSKEQELYDHESDPFETVNLAALPAGADEVGRLHPILLERSISAFHPSAGHVSPW